MITYDNKTKLDANSIVYNALKKRVLEKEPCCHCGSSKIIHAHHYDYSKPLSIVWLCPKCHSGIHMGKNIRMADNTGIIYKYFKSAIEAIEYSEKSEYVNNINSKGHGFLVTVLTKTRKDSSCLKYIF